MNLTDHSVIDLGRGYFQAGASDWGSTRFECLYCQTTFEAGVVYPAGNRLFSAERAVVEHVRSEHGGPAAALLAQEGELTGLSDVQRTVIGLLVQGADDAEIARALGGRSESTVRNHRYQLRRRAREARVLVALTELVARGGDQDFVDYHSTLPVDDDRTIVTHGEAAAILQKFFEDRELTRLSRFPKKEKQKLVVLRHLVERFEPGMRYSEKQVNELLIRAYADYAVIRRWLVDYRFLARERDGSAYWRTDA